ncbi:unnamed protein product [Pedinophyceae sp. YPF-701]|nr:unnamed protein product [Pedinophyceae sp. YPF-701]
MVHTLVPCPQAAAGGGAVHVQARSRSWAARYGAPLPLRRSWRAHAAQAPRSAPAQRRRRLVRARAATQEALPTLAIPEGSDLQPTVVMKFGGSSVRDAERMREVAEIVCSCPCGGDSGAQGGYLPCLVLSAMGKTTNMLLEAGDAALRCTSAPEVAEIAALENIKELHRATMDELEVDEETRAEVERLLGGLEQLLVGAMIMEHLSNRARDQLVSYGERMSTRIFAGYLRRCGIPARQVDAFAAGMVTDDAFTNADVQYAEALPALRESLSFSPGEQRAVQVVTGFLGRGKNTGAVTTLGRGGSDLTCTVLGAALGLPEVQVWKDVDGVLTSDPRLVPGALPVRELTYEEATELAYFGAQVLHPAAMRPAQQTGNMAVRVMNSYNRTAPGTAIRAERDLSKSLLTSIVLKDDVTIVDVVSSRSLGQVGFLAKVFEVFRQNGISVDMVATSEVSVSVSLDPAKIWRRPVEDHELEDLGREFAEFAEFRVRRGAAIVSLVCNVQRSSEILQRVFATLFDKGINAEMISQGSSKTNVSIVIDQSRAKEAVTAIHSAFF